MFLNMEGKCGGQCLPSLGLKFLAAAAVVTLKKLRIEPKDISQGPIRTSVKYFT